MTRIYIPNNENTQKYIERKERAAILIEDAVSLVVLALAFITIVLFMAIL